MHKQLEALELIASMRRTVKVMSASEQSGSTDRALVERLLASAGWAPFHRACSPEHRDGDLTGIEPWRFYAVDSECCRQLRKLVLNNPVAGKVPAMLATAQALILATWLPNVAQGNSTPTVDVTHGSVDSEAFEPTLVNVEHIAAASAAIQTLLLAATAAGIENYWSSGGVLRSSEILSKLNIPAKERVLGAVFLFPGASKVDGTIEVATSNLRGQRSPAASWSRWVQF
jgi:nitroreductase